MRPLFIKLIKREEPKSILLINSNLDWSSVLDTVFHPRITPSQKDKGFSPMQKVPHCHKPASTTLRSYHKDRGLPEYISVKSSFWKGYIPSCDIHNFRFLSIANTKGLYGYSYGPKKIHTGRSRVVFNCTSGQIDFGHPAMSFARTHLRATGSIRVGCYYFLIQQNYQIKCLNMHWLPNA